MQEIWDIPSWISIKDTGAAVDRGWARIAVPMMRCLIRNKASRIGARPDWAASLPELPGPWAGLLPRADIIFLAAGPAGPATGAQRHAQRSRPSVGLRRWWLLLAGNGAWQRGSVGASDTHKNWNPLTLKLPRGWSGSRSLGRSLPLGPIARCTQTGLHSHTRPPSPSFFFPVPLSELCSR